MLKERLWALLDKEGHTLAALNAALFASELDEKVATRIVAARKSVAEKIIRKYCVGKGVLVALNPVPVTDLLAAAGSDVAMVIHLGEVYGFTPVTPGGSQAAADDFRATGGADGRLLGYEPGDFRPEDRQRGPVDRADGDGPGRPGLVRHLRDRQDGANLVLTRQILGQRRAAGNRPGHSGLDRP